ncbi:MAG: DUF1343 domain-containing protein [Gemmatimonadetes bacterium]|nr:DUF1343 domain-containing protein [Gemmatimonadota bacterium]
MIQRLGSVAVMAAVVAACGESGGAVRPVRPGIEVLLTDSLHLVHGVRVGILTNQTGVNQAGRSDIDLLRAAQVNLTAIFSPEHGFRGTLDRENIGNTLDSATGVPIYSLYGTVRAPTRDMWASVDVLLIDLQDIGGRPYTYISSTLLSLRSARENGRRVIVLDRPNPIGGDLVQGPLLDSSFATFIGMLPIPLRHGLTLGELARVGNDALGLNADLVVVPADGWHRADWFDRTGLPWIKPSPNMPDVESATQYPGLVLFEATNLSVGRGTPVAFQVLAAPWLNAAGLIARVPPIPGVALSDTLVFPQAPGDGKYGGQEIPAVRFRVTRRAVYDPALMAVSLLIGLRSLHRDSLRIDARAFDLRAGSSQLREDLERDYTSNRIWNAWRADLDNFVQRRKPYLLYN